MAKNESEYAVHAVGEDGALVSVLPGGDIPSGVEVSNPLVRGKASEQDGKVVEDKPAAKRPGRPAAAKDSDES